MNRLQGAAETLRSGFERQFQSTGSASLFVGLACNLAFVGQVYFWPALWHTSAFTLSYTDATYIAEFLCALVLGLHLGRGGTPWISGRVLWIAALLVQITLVAYCIMFELGIDAPDGVNWLFGAVFGVYLPLAMVSWLEVHMDLDASSVVWNIMLSALFASFAIWVFSGLVGVKICACMALLLFIATFVLTRKLKVARAETTLAPASEEADVKAFRYSASATFLFSFAFITAISFAGIAGDTASFATGAFFAPMLLICVLALLVNVSAFPLASIAVPAIVMATIATSSLHIDPALSFDLAALGMFLFLAYAVVLLCGALRGNARGAAMALLRLMVAFTAGCIIGRVCMALCFQFAGDFASDILVVLSVVTANAAMVILIRRGAVLRRSGEVFGAEEEEVPEQVAQSRRAAEIDRVAAEANLGEREKEVLVLLLEGKSASEVARALVVANGTAKSHIRHVYKKLGIHSREELFGLFDEGREVSQPRPLA